MISKLTGEAWTKTQCRLVTYLAHNKPCLDTATADGNVNDQAWIRTTHPTAANINSNPHATTSTHPAAETRKLVVDITRHSSTKETNYKQLTPLTNLT